MHGINPNEKNWEIWNLAEKSQQQACSINVIEKLNTVDKIVSWDLHMEAIQHALPNFDAAGHFNYTKSADLYLQSMVDLESTIK